MKNLLVSILGLVTLLEVSQTIRVVKRWNSYKNENITLKEIPCSEKQTIIQIVEHNPINDFNIDSFFQVYGINEENIHSKPFRKKTKKDLELLIEPKKIVPEPPKFKIKVAKTK